MTSRDVIETHSDATERIDCIQFSPGHTRLTYLLSSSLQSVDQSVRNCWNGLIGKDNLRCSSVTIPVKYTHACTRLAAIFPWLPGWAGTRKAKTNLDFTEARDSEWQWHQPSHMQVCISLQTDNHSSTPPLSFLQAGCPSCRPTNCVKALK